MEIFKKIKDDEDEEYEETDIMAKSREEKRRLSHTVAEQKRRNAIKVSAAPFLSVAFFVPKKNLPALFFLPI